MALITPDQRAKFIKQKASQHNFDFCGISKAEKLEAEEARLEKWLNKGFHGEMRYMENHFEKRLDPSKLVPGAKSMVSFIYNYYPEEDLADDNNYKVAKYAYGKDYHNVIKAKLRRLVTELQEEIGEFAGRIFVDSAPVMERTWAARSGLGWIGKNTLLLNREMGSFFFLAFLVTDLELAPDNPIADYCGTCTRCIDACPTEAIPQPYIVDASKCISYFTIELKGAIPDGFESKFDNWIFGCDICQDVCPWNRFSKPHKEPGFDPAEELKSFEKNDWKEITEEVFQRIFKDSALTRTGFKGIMRNIDYISEQK